MIGSPQRAEELRFVITIRQTDRPEDMIAVVDLQLAVWGSEPVPAHQLIATARNGGCVFVAEQGPEIVGFCYGFSGGSYLLSHLLAVHPKARRQGLARRLKLAQRGWAREVGFSELRWTFDPLRAANARLNLHQLGATVAAYHENYYGSLLDSLNRGPTDRLEVRWPTSEVPVLKTQAVTPLFQSGVFTAPKKAGDWVSLALPGDYPSPENKTSVLALLRQGFQWAFQAGYRGVDFGPEGYLLRPWS